VSNKEKAKILNELLEIIIQSSPQCQECFSAYRSWISNKNLAFIVPHQYAQAYEILSMSIYLGDKFISTNFSPKTALTHAEKKIISLKKLGRNFDESSASSIFEELYKISPETKKIFAPISGIRLSNHSKFSIGAYVICHSSQFTIPISQAPCMCIGVTVEDVYDDIIALNIATNLFIDFCRIVHFFLGKFDNNHVIKIGLPALPSLSPTQMYVESSSFMILGGQDEFLGASTNNRTLEIIDIDNNLFIDHTQLSPLWNMHVHSIKDGKTLSNNDRKKFNKKLSTRIINSSIATGEAAKNEDIKNSMIYACVALETLLSYDHETFINDDNSFFKRVISAVRYVFTKKKKSLGITERMAISMAFILGKDKKSYDHVYSRVKKLYGMRSALVHGGQKIITMNDSAELGSFVRAAIAILLIDSRFTKMETIDELWTYILNSKQ